MTLRLLHFADLHLGVETHGQFRPELGYSSRVQDFLNAFDQVIETAITERVDAVLFAGDAFKNAEPSPTLQRHFAARIQRLLAAAIPTVLLVGNHDRPRSPSRSTPMDIYAALQLPGIIVASRPDFLRVQTRHGPLQIVALPWMPMRQLLADDELRALPEHEFERRFREIISANVQALLTALDPAHPAVFLAHLTMEGGRFGSERNVLLGNDPLFALDELGLDRAPIDYVALGHLHSHQVIHRQPPVIYAGSIERIDFGEEREEKGFIIVSIEPGTHPRQVTWEFRPLQTRAMCTVRFEVTSENPMEQIRSVLERRANELRDAIVRLFVVASPERATAIRTNEIRRWLLELGATYVAGVVVETERSIRPRVDVTRETRNDPVALLERWVRLRQLSDEFANAVLSRGREIIERVEASDFLKEKAADQR